MPPTRRPQLAPYLAVHDALGLVHFIEEGIGGTQTYEERDETGRVAHAEMKVSDSLVMLAEVPEGRRPFPAMIHLYVPDADAAFARALAAGAQPVAAPTDKPDGDRRGGVADPWGNEWWFTRAQAGSAEPQVGRGTESGLPRAP